MVNTGILLVFFVIMEIGDKMQELAMCVNNESKNVNAFDMIDAIKNAGFKNVFIQWYNKEYWQPTQEEQLQHIKELGLNVLFAHLGYKDINNIWLDGVEGEQLIDYYKHDLDFCKKNNIPMVIMHLTTKKEPPLYNELGIKRFQRIVDYAKKLNIKVAFENTKVEGYLDYVITHIDNDNVGICYDAGHCHCHFNDQFNYELFKDRIFAVHLHDNDQSEDQHLIPFDGTIDWDYVIKKLNDNGYQGPVTLELIYDNQYYDIDINDYYKKGYDIAVKLAKMFEEL